jgi:hypothetical protein
LSSSVPKSGYWRVLVVAICAPESGVAHLKAAFSPGVVKVGFA